MRVIRLADQRQSQGGLREQHNGERDRNQCDIVEFGHLTYPPIG